MQYIHKIYSQKINKLCYKALISIGTLVLMSMSSLSLSVQAVGNVFNDYNNFLNGIEYLNYTLPKNITDNCYKLDNCPTIDIQYLNSNQIWINTIINHKIDQITIHNIDSFIENYSQNLTVKQALDRFITIQPEDINLAYSLEVSPEYLGHINNFELLAIDSYIYTGGAHGLPYREYFIFDEKTHQQLTLDTILLANQKTQFEKLAYNAYQQWVKDNIQQDTQDYEQNWKFFLSDNITLTDKGINILYQPYDIAPYALGMPTLTIEYKKLNGIIKPEILTRIQNH